MTERSISQERVKEVLRYYPETGAFVWIKKTAPRANRIIIGATAGVLCEHGYIAISISKYLYYAHRLAWIYMTGDWPQDQMDHINHIRSDNRFCNLRLANNTINSKNRPLSKNNQSGVSGVYWNKRNKIWVANIKINRKTKYLGSSRNLFDAICYRKSADNRQDFHDNHGRL